MEFDGYTIILLMFIFTSLFVSGTGGSYGDSTIVQAFATLMAIPFSIFAFLGSNLIGLLVAGAVFLWLASNLGSGVMMAAVFAFLILLLGA